MRRQYLIFVLLLSACGSDAEPPEEPAPMEEEEIREIPAPPEMPPVNNPVNNNLNNPILEMDMDEDLTEEDQGPVCVCTVGFTRCQGELEQFCEEDPNSPLPDCGQWGTVSACPSPQQVCILTQCGTPEGCIDNDGDGYGNGCDLGPDCDDSDPTVYPGAPELCDGKDNSCNGVVDSGLNLGETCTVGVGACRGTGVYVCNANLTAVCNATPGTPTAEICDNIDNDCDGQIDEDEVCGTDFCDLDPFEPNDTIVTASPLPASRVAQAISCDQDLDFFSFTTQPNQIYRVNLAYWDFLGEATVDLFANGALVNPTRTSHFNGERLTFSSVANTSYVARVTNLSQTDTYYQISVVPQSSSCSAEDLFAPNATRQTASVLFPEWYIQGAVCAGARDWYSLGTVDAGDAIEAYLDSVVSPAGDLDLYLWHDPNNDGIFTVARSSFNSGNDEELFYTVPTTGPYFLEVRDYAGSGGHYRLEWYLN